MKSIICGKILAALVLVAAVVSPGSLLAQESRGTITGTVTDSAKAVIQGGYELLEMRPIGLSLEEIFLELTRDNASGKKSS